ncbi:MAG: LLM class flavin-dependent oxidoreductase [Candidatus Binatia bacterium]
MRIGLFSVVDHYPTELDRTVQRFYDELLDQATAADELGLASFWVAEHHFHEYGVIPRPAVWLAAAARVTRRIRLGSAVVVLPFDNPLRVAEDYAMADLLSDGRLELGIGSGYLAHEFAGFGIHTDDRRARFQEALDIILAAWTGEPVTYAGKFYRCDRVKLNVRPKQQPTPPLAMAILHAERAREVAVQGFSMMMIPYATTEHIDELAEAVSAYREAFRPVPHIGGGGRVYCALHAHCGETRGAARAATAEPLDRYVRTRLYARQRSYEELDSRQLMAVGDPDDLCHVLRAYATAGFTDCLLIANFGGFRHAEVLRSLERISRYVVRAVGTADEN